MCIHEKLEIWRKNKPGRILNKHAEVFRRCLHRFKHFVAYLLMTRDFDAEGTYDHNLNFLNELRENVIVCSGAIKTQQDQTMDDIEWGLRRSKRSWRNHISLV